MYMQINRYLMLHTSAALTGMYFIPHFHISLNEINSEVLDYVILNYVHTKMEHFRLFLMSKTCF